MATARSVSEPGANERLKASFETVLATSLVIATVVHFLVLQLWPAMHVTPLGATDGVPPEIIRLDEVMLPPAPEPIPRPAFPRISADASPETTIEAVDFSEYAPPPPPPPAAETRTPGSEVRFTPVANPPRLVNPDELMRALERAYPPALRDAGLGGTVTLYVHVSEVGGVLEARVGSPSGYEALDAAAVGLAGVMRFRPARNFDQDVAVWIAMPVEFRVR